MPLASPCPIRSTYLCLLMSSTPLGRTRVPAEATPPASTTTLQLGGWKWEWPRWVLTRPSCRHLILPVSVHKCIEQSCEINHFASTGNFPPVVNGSDIFVVTIGATSVYSFSVTDDSGLGTHASVVGGIPRAGNLTNISNAFTFSWNPATTEDVYGLTFYATDLLGATGILRPKVYVCSCLNGGNCTWEGTFSSIRNVTTMQCNCPPGEPWTTLVPLPLLCILIISPRGLLPSHTFPHISSPHISP